MVILCNRHFIILKRILDNKGLHSVSIEQTALKSGNNFSNYNKFTDTSWNEEFQTWKPLSPIFACIPL